MTIGLLYNESRNALRNKVSFKNGRVSYFMNVLWYSVPCRPHTVEMQSECAFNNGNENQSSTGVNEISILWGKKQSHLI